MTNEERLKFERKIEAALINHFRHTGLTVHDIEGNKYLNLEQTVSLSITDLSIDLAQELVHGF